MPSDKFSNLYTDETLVKGVWYGYKAGPKPQVFTGNIDTINNLENIRNVALIINSASSSNGTFPNGTGRNYAILTIRYGDGNGVYVQKAIDLSDPNKIEYERVCLDNSWGATSTAPGGWRRVSSVGDSSTIANEAYNRSNSNLEEIKNINAAIGRSSGANPSNLVTVYKRIENAQSQANNALQYGKDLRTDCTVTFQAHDVRINSALDHSTKIINSDEGASNTGIKVYTGKSQFQIGYGATSWKILDTGHMTNWGFDNTNSVFMVSNGNSDLNSAHVEGGTFVPDDGTGTRGGWYAVFEGSTNTDILFNWVLFVYGQPLS